MKLAPAVALVRLAAALVAGGCEGGVAEDVGARADEEPISTATSARAGCRAQLAPLRRGFGSAGPHAVEILTVTNPEFPELGVTLYRPAAMEVAPLIIFGHGNGLADPSNYSRLLHHIASRGYAVVYPAHQVDSERHEDRYRALWSGVLAAVDEHRERLDLERVGFVGHSYGAGALPYIAHRALVNEGFGRRGALLLSMAPWYALKMTDARWSELPNHLEALILSFDEDEVTDHRIAIALYDALAVDRKTYLMVRSDHRGGCELRADHAVPQTGGLGGRDDPLDEVAIFRLFDALAASAFEDDPAARRVAHGNGSPDQLAMGSWADGTPVSPLHFSADPQPEKPQTAYLFQYADREAWQAYPDEPGQDSKGAVQR